MAEPYLIYMEREGMENSGRLAGYTLAGVFGKAVTTAPDGDVLLENESLIGAIRLTETVIEKAAGAAGRYTVSGKLALPQGWETYAPYITEVSDFTGSASVVKLSDGYRIAFSLEAPLSGSFPFERTEYGEDGIRRVKHRMIGANRLSLALTGQWKGEGEVTKESLAAAEFSCRLKIDELGEVDLRHRLFCGNAWVFTVNFSPALSLANVAAFIGKLVGAPEVVSSIVLPEGIVGLDFLAVSGLVVTLSPQLLIQSIEVLLTMAAAWKPGVPYFSVEELEISLYFSIPTQEQDEVYAACGISGIFLIRPKKGLNLRLAMWCDIPGLTASGELLAVQEQEYDPPLTELLSAYGVPSADVDGLTVASLRYVASVPGRSLWLEFEMDTSQILSFSILGLPISVTEISGDFSYHPDALSLTLGGQLRIGKEQPFLLGLSFSYDCEGESGWHFTAALMEGEVSVAAVLTDLLGVNTLRDDPVFDLKLTDFAAEFYSNDRGPFTVRAALEQPWSTRLLGVNLVLFGSVDMTKAADGTKSGTLMAGFRLNAFQLKVFYGLVKGADYRFQIWYENAYLEARYEKREKKELLVLGLKGMTLYGLVSGFVHMVNPNADFKLSAPWDILDRIRLDDFSLEFDVENRTVSMLYAAELNILGLVEIRQIGIRYSRRETGKVEFVLVGSLLEQEYTIGDPLTWDAIDDNPPDIGGSDNQVIRLSYLGMGQHFGTEALLSATRIAEAVEALKNAIHPVDAGERPKLSYAEGVNWLFGADMTYRGMLRVQFVLNDPSLYGILITVKQGEDSALAQFAGLSLELLYRKVTDDIGMFSAELMIPDRFKVLRFGAISVTLGRFYMEIYTNGNFYLDLGFPHQQDFGESFVVEAGYYTGRGGFYFGILSQETCEKVPKIVNGRFAPVIAIGVGLSLGIGRSFDFAVVKGAVSLEFFAIFEGLFAVYTPADASQKKDFYYHAKAVAGIYGRLFLSVDFVILAISATAEVRAYASVELASYQPILFAVDLDLKVGASIKILFIRISFSFHFSMHMDFAIGEASKTPWKLADKEHRKCGAVGYAPYLFRRVVDGMYGEQTLCVKRDLLCDGERVDIAVRILPLYTVMQPSLEPHAAFLLLVARDESGFAQIVKIAQEWIVSHLEETVSCNSMERLFGQLREETEEFTAYFKKRTRLVLTAVPENAADLAEEDGVFFPVVPGMIYRFMTYDAAGELIYDETHDFAEEPKVDASYMEMLSAYFARLNPAPEDVAGAQAAGKTRSGMEEAKALSEVLLEDYLAVILQAVTREVSGRMRRVQIDTRGKTLNELAKDWDDMRIPFRKRHGETWQSVADEVGMPVEALRYKNSMRKELSGTADGTVRFISVGVTPHSILLDNPAWKFSADTITVEGDVYAAAGMSVEQMMRENRIPLDALVRAIGDERAVLRDEQIVIRNVPFFARDKVRSMLGTSEIAEQAAGMVSRFFLQGLRLPIPNAPEGMRRDAAFLNRRENWAGLYQIIGQQKELLYDKDAAEDFLRHKLTVTAAAGYEEWIAAGEEYAVEISNEEIAVNAPDALFVPVFEQELREIKPYILEKRQHPFAEYLLYVKEGTRRSILTFTRDFMRVAEGHFSDYAWYADSMQSGFGRTMGENLTGEDRKGGFGLLLALNIKKVDEVRPVYEVTVTDKGSSAKLYAVQNVNAANVNLLYEPSVVDGRETGLYDLPLQKEHTRLVMTNLSRETKSSPNLRAQEEVQDVAYVASAAEPAAFLALLWQLSVTNAGGYYLCLAEEGILPESLFSSAGAGKLWLLVTGDIGETGCNCVVDEQEISPNEYAWLALKDECAGIHPQEYVVKSILNPGSAGFAAVLAQPQNPETCKEDAIRNLYSIINYRVHGSRYEDCETGMPLLPKEQKDGANVWEYSQSVPLNRFLESGSDNPYDAVGMPAEMELEFRDVLGNTAETEQEACFRLGITPRYNDALLAIDQTGAVAAGYLVKDGQLLLAIEPALESALQEEKREAALTALEKSRHQIQAAGTKLCLESTLLAAAAPLPCEDILTLYDSIRSWLVWTKSLNRVKCAVFSLKEAVSCYGKSPDELLGENLDVSLTGLFGETKVSYPVMKTWHSGMSLAGMQSESGWVENKDALLRAGTEVIISREAGREYIVPTKTATFAQAAAAIGCDVASLVEDNSEKKGILSEGYEFAFQGYEVQVGIEAGVTASLSDVCAAFAEYFKVDVTPMELVAEETVGILLEGVTLIYRKLTAAEGETLSYNNMGCSAEQLWNLNFDTKDFLAEGTAVWCATETVDAAEAVDIRNMCQVYGITTTQFYLANCGMPLQTAGLLTISGNIAYPQAAYQNSFVLPENGGAGYSIAEICKAYGCENGVWFYRLLQDILIEGREIEAAQTTVTVSRFDTLESVERKLQAIGAEDQNIWMDAVIVKDGITLPFVPAGIIYREQIDETWIRSRQDILLKLDAKLHLFRETNMQEETPEDIYHAWSAVLPGDGCNQDTSFDEFVTQIEASMPFAYVIQGVESQGTENDLYLWLAKGDGTKGINDIKFGPWNIYDDTVKTPAIYALAPISTKLVSREAVEIAQLEADGTLGEAEAVNFTGIDIERWAVLFLEDVEAMLSPQMVEKTVADGCTEQLARLLVIKELLAQKLPSRLCHVLVPLGQAGQEGMTEAKNAFSEQLRVSLPDAYGKNVLLQYPGTVAMEGMADCVYRLAGDVIIRDFAEPVSIRAGKIGLENGAAYLHVFAEAARLRNASFSLEKMQYHIRELEMLPQQERGDYLQSSWFSFLNPVDETRYGKNMELELSCALPVPVPLRFYPKQPVLKEHRIVLPQQQEEGTGDINEYLSFDYRVTFGHEMAGADMIYLTVVFNEKPKAYVRDNAKDLFDALAQYVSVRETLQKMLQEAGKGFQGAYRTMVALADDTAQKWEVFGESVMASSLQETTYACHMRTWCDSDTLRIELFTQEPKLPELCYIRLDGTEVHMQSEQTADGAAYWVSGISETEMSTDITLCLTLKGLSIFEYQSVYTRSHVTRNEALSDTRHPVNERFLYRTEDAAFANPMNVLIGHEKEIPVVIPADYEPKQTFAERAVRYLFEEIFHLKEQNAQISCQISYGYQISDTDIGADVQLPVCLQPRTAYSDKLRQTLSDTVTQWYAVHKPPMRGRYLHMEVTVFGTELEEEGLPIVRLGGIKIGETELMRIF